MIERPVRIVVRVASTPLPIQGGVGLPLVAHGMNANPADIAISYDVLIVADSGDSRKMRIEVEFARQFSGRRNVYARAEDKAQQSSRWCWLGSWIVP
jgi:hypothetical protein